MVHELHKQGWQHLRIYSGLSPSGMHWRCAIFPKELTIEEVETHYDQRGPEITVARYSTGEDRAYFGWEDCSQDDSRQLARKFLERFANLANRGRGRDWAYAGWFTELLGHAEHGDFPISYWDPMSDDSLEDMKRAVWLTSSERAPFPLPPPKGIETDF